jgi:Co/Zn/Cd efflux system component
MLASGLLVWRTGMRMADLVEGLAIGLYVAKEAMEILREASRGDLMPHCQADGKQ